MVPRLARYHVGPCHAHGWPRRILIRSEKREGPFRAWAPFLGYVPALPLSAVLRIRNPLARPSSVFINGAAIGFGVWDKIHQCRGPALSVLDRFDHLRAPRTPDACCTVQTVVNQIAQVPELPARAENPGFDSPLLCWAGRLRNLLVPVCSGLDVDLHHYPLPARPPTS